MDRWIDEEIDRSNIVTTCESTVSSIDEREHAIDL